MSSIQAVNATIVASSVQANLPIRPTPKLTPSEIRTNQSLDSIRESGKRIV